MTRVTRLFKAALRPSWRMTLQGLSWASIASGFAILGVAPTIAQTNPSSTAAAQIVNLQSDWNANALMAALSTGTPLVNPGNCGLTDGFYEINPSDNGVTLNQSLLISAYMAHTTVRLAIQGCSISNRPHIVGVSVPN